MREIGRFVCVAYAVISLAGCATRDVAVLDAESKTVTYNGKTIDPSELIAIAVSHKYGEADLIVRSTNGVEKTDLRQTTEALIFWLILPDLAPKRDETNGADRTPNQVPEDTARKLADPQH